MSKKKNRFKAKNKPKEVIEKIIPEKKITPKSPDKKTNEMKSEFKRVATIMLFIIAILITLYYYDQKNNVLQIFTDQLFSLF